MTMCTVGASSAETDVPPHAYATGASVEAGSEERALRVATETPGVEGMLKEREREGIVKSAERREPAPVPPVPPPPPPPPWRQW